MSGKLKSFECKSCGFIIHIEEDRKEPLFCPMCRSSMREIRVEVSPEKIKKIKCPQCEYEFYLDKGQNPYKCPNCNFTFPVTPHRVQEERL